MNVTSGEVIGTYVHIHFRDPFLSGGDVYTAIHKYLEELPKNFERENIWPCWETNNHDMVSVFQESERDGIITRKYRLIVCLFDKHPLKSVRRQRPHSNLLERANNDVDPSLARNIDHLLRGRDRDERHPPHTLQPDAGSLCTPALFIVSRRFVPGTVQRSVQDADAGACMVDPSDISTQDLR